MQSEVVLNHLSDSEILLPKLPIKNFPHLFDRGAGLHIAPETRVPFEGYDGKRDSDSRVDGSHGEDKEAAESKDRTYPEKYVEGRSPAPGSDANAPHLSLRASVLDLKPGFYASTEMRVPQHPDSRVWTRQPLRCRPACLTMDRMLYCSCPPRGFISSLKRVWSLTPWSHLYFAFFVSLFISNQILFIYCFLVFFLMDYFIQRNPMIVLHGQQPHGCPRCFVLFLMFEQL